MKDGQDHGFTLYDLSERVRMRGWLIASYPLPANRGSTIIQRILIRHGVSRDLAQLLLDDLGRALAASAGQPGAAFRAPVRPSITERANITGGTDGLGETMPSFRRSAWR